MLAGAAGSRRITLPATIRFERQIPQLEHFAHAAAAEPFDGLEALERGQRVSRRRRWFIASRAAVESEGDRPIAIDQAIEGLDEVGTAAAEIRRREDASVENVLFDEAREQCFDLRFRVAHVLSRPASFRVRAVIARASSIRQASSDFPSRCAISANDSSSNLRSRMT